MKTTQLSGESLARRLGWLSLGLGSLEVLRGGTITRAIGGRRASVMRGYGVREIGTGAGLLASLDPTPWIWGRVAGDALDLWSLLRGFRRSDRKATLALTVATTAGIAAFDIACLRRLRASRRTLPATGRTYGAR